MPKVTIRTAPNGRAYLNAGCGGIYSTEWNNMDLQPSRHVVRHDIRKPLPYPDCGFDAVYSSHVLEHLTFEDGKCFMREMYRVCKPGGICRIVVPDYEEACRQYLHWLEAALAGPTTRTIQCYRWAVIELIDQCVRDKSGGKMGETLRSGDFDEEYVRQRNGDQFASYYSSTEKRMTTETSLGASVGLRNRIKRSPLGPWVRVVLAVIHSVLYRTRREPGPRNSGEVHRWMYDRLSLRLLMEEVGFAVVKVKSFDESDIHDWCRYRLDASEYGHRSRKPDSLYMEGIKPISA